MLEVVTMTTNTLMHKARSASQPAKTERRYTVSYVPGRRINYTPALHICGKWLNEAGFPIGTHVTVKIVGGCIVLIPDNDEKRELRDEIKMLKEQVKGIKKSVFGVIEVSENPEIKREKWLRDWRGCFRIVK